MTRPSDVLQSGPILLYDGKCGVCSQAVQWVLTHERSHSLRFAAIESTVGSELRALAGVSADVDSMLWAELRDGRVHAETRSSAVLRVLGYVGGPWRWFTALRIVPAFVRDAGYRAFAKLRYRLRPPSCLVPTAQERARFLGMR
jgi:predicted DCC family thiol-disulfide oxidoreductase YuxK